MTARALISCLQMQAEIASFRELLEENHIEIVLPAVVQQLDEDQLLAIIGQFDGVIAGDDHFTARVLRQSKKLRILSKWGIGIDNIDLEEADRLGIKVTNTPDTLSGEVADVCIGYLVMMARELHLVDRLVRQGDWPKPIGVSLDTQVLGIVGLGGIGRALATRALAMGMTVMGCDPGPKQREIASEMGVIIMETTAILRQCDFLSLNCPLTGENHHLIDERAISAMKPRSRIINTARGGLIDEKALIKALESGHLKGAALDVFELEPLSRNSPLRRMDQVILGSHNSSNTKQANYRVSEIALKNLLTGLGLQT